MTLEQFDELKTTIQRMAVTADALGRTCHMLAAGETDAARHAFFHRLHVALTDCKLALHHALNAAPTMVQA